MSQGSLNPKIRFLGQKVWPVARGRTDGQTDGHTRKWKQRAPFQGFRSFSFNLSSRIGPKIHAARFLDARGDEKQVINLERPKMAHFKKDNEVY